jgi:galactokinase
VGSRSAGALRVAGGSDLIAIAPGRVNIIGDHTDYVGGLAMPCAIDLAVTATFEPIPDRIDLSSDATAEHASLTVPVDGDISPDETMWQRVVHAVASLVQPTHGVSGRLTTTLPIGAGLSSSAACTIAVALALGFEGDGRSLVLLAQAAEHRATGVPCGVLDQLAIVFGRAGEACIVDAAAVRATTVPVPPSVAIVIVHSGHARALSDTPYAQRRAEAERAVEAIGGLDNATLGDANAVPDALLRRRARHVVSENQRVRDCADAFAAGDVKRIGELIRVSHISLRDDAEVSTHDLDSLVDALSSRRGVYGARLTGAGFGGSAVALAEPSAAVTLAETFGGRVVIPSAGARLVS